MKIRLLLIQLILFVGLYAYDFQGTDFISPGEIYPLLFTPDTGKEPVSGSLKLIDSKGRVIALTELISLEEMDTRNGWVYLLGIGPEVDPGTYTLDVTCDQQGETLFFRKKLQIVEREFSHQTVSLNKTLTTLRSQPDPRKTRESRLLWSVLSTTNPGHFYHWGPLSLPVVGEYITSTEYGARRIYHYDTGEESRTLHSGVDWAAPLGTDIVAPGSGRVALAMEMLVTGNTLILEHMPGVYTVFYHMDTLEVEEGDIVGQGQWLGTMGQSGLATGSHLHWELRVSRSPVDPIYYLTHPLLDKSAIISMIDANKQ